MMIKFLLLASVQFFFIMIQTTSSETDEVFPELKAFSNLDSQKVKLGRILFHDKRLSKDNSVSCASCHDLATGGDDGRSVSIGVNGKKGKLNSPTVFNAALNFRQFWDGRAFTLEEQVLGPIENPIEMATSIEEIIEKIRHYLNQ